MNQEARPIKGYCAWVGPDNRLRIRRARISPDGIANVRRGPKGAKVLPLRTFQYKRRTGFILVGNSGQALDIHGLKADSIVTSTDIDEIANNNYAGQLMSELQEKKNEAVRDWVMIAAIGVLLVLQIYAFNETKDALGALAQMLAARFPAPPGAVA